MSTGAAMIAWLALLLAGWFRIDYMLWVKGFETATQFYIKTAHAWPWLDHLTGALIVWGAVWLLQHLEILERIQ